MKVIIEGRLKGNKSGGNREEERGVGERGREGERENSATIIVCLPIHTYICFYVYI
jgi:hypothetical protein